MYGPSRISLMTNAEIIALFERYGFTDRQGHDLLLCKDFFDLVDRATEDEGMCVRGGSEGHAVEGKPASGN